MAMKHALHKCGTTIDTTHRDTGMIVITPTSKVVNNIEIINKLYDSVLYYLLKYPLDFQWLDIGTTNLELQSKRKITIYHDLQ